jgi:hypothetical protein
MVVIISRGVGVIVPVGQDFSHLQSQSKIHIATDSQTVGLSWCRAQSGAYVQQLVYLF